MNISRNCEGLTENNLFIAFNGLNKFVLFFLFILVVFFLFLVLLCCQF